MRGLPRMWNPRIWLRDWLNKRTPAEQVASDTLLLSALNEGVRRGLANAQRKVERAANPKPPLQEPRGDE
ncbi:hypothetical protein D3C81_315350 [compost metagenome]